MSDNKIDQFDFFIERDKLQKEIEEKVNAFLLRCGSSKLAFELNPKYVHGIGAQNWRLIGFEFIIES